MEPFLDLEEDLKMNVEKKIDYFNEEDKEFDEFNQEL